MYPYWNGPSLDTITRVIDTENHYYSEKNSNPIVDSVNIAEFPIPFDFTDISKGNCVSYIFLPSSGTIDPGSSEEPGLGPIIDPGSQVGPISEFDPTTT